jgi:hypothetical protein
MASLSYDDNKGPLFSVPFLSMLRMEEGEKKGK